MHIFELLARDHPVPPVCVLFGDEAFLKGLARRRIIEQILGEHSDVPYAVFQGDAVSWRDVWDELSTMSMFGGRQRLVVVQSADRFVSEHRDRLEDYVEKPRPRSVLLLEVETWPRNTRLFKAIDSTGLQIECRAPEKAVGKRSVLDESAVRRWLVDRAAGEHRFQLSKEAAEMLFQLVGPEFGLLDQELAKLALLAGPVGKISAEQVATTVGGGRAKSVWELADRAAEGKTAEALAQLDRLLQSGEHPLGLFGQLAWSWRRLAAATRIYEASERAGRRCSLSQALIDAGVPHWNRESLASAERQLKHLGRQRAAQLYQWLLETDLALKGSHSAPDRARLALEKLMLRMSGDGRQSAVGSRQSAVSSRQ